MAGLRKTVSLPADYTAGSIRYFSIELTLY